MIAAFIFSIAHMPKTWKLFQRQILISYIYYFFKFFIIQLKHQPYYLIKSIVILIKIKLHNFKKVYCRKNYLEFLIMATHKGWPALNTS